MSKRLQIVMDEAEWETNAAAARAAGLSLSEWARQAMRRARPGAPSRSYEEVMAAVLRAAEVGAPVPDTVEEMNAEIESGYRK